MDRYNLFYIWGIDSQLGKTKLAESIFEKPYIISDSMDFRGWNREHYDGLVIHDAPEVRQIILQYKCLYLQVSNPRVWAPMLPIAMHMKWI